MEKNTFKVLNDINCNGHTEKKGQLTYLSWAWAWQMVKQNFPKAFYTIYENAAGLCYHTDGHTCWVKTGVTIDGLEHIEYLPVMDNRNNSIPLEKVVSTDVNKAIQRSLTKACARHGLGLYIYAGEDLPDVEQQAASKRDEQDYDLACQRIKEARNREELTAVWNDCPKYHGNNDFLSRIQEKAKTLAA